MLAEAKEADEKIAEAEKARKKAAMERHEGSTTPAAPDAMKLGEDAEEVANPTADDDTGAVESETQEQPRSKWLVPAQMSATQKEKAKCLVELKIDPRGGSRFHSIDFECEKVNSETKFHVSKLKFRARYLIFREIK